MFKYCDAHCHFDFGNPYDDGAFCDVINPVKLSICNATCEDGWNKLIEFGASHKCVAVCLGLHPWWANAACSGWNARLYDILRAHPEIMIGEIGLDATRDDPDLQYDIFMRQLEIARELSRPIQLHCTHAWDKVLKIFAGERFAPSVVAHGFNGSPELIRELMRHVNIYFSYSPRILNSKNSKMRECVANTPLNRILTESDDNPISGAMKIPRIAEKIAEIKSLDMARASEILYNNTMRMMKNE